MRDIDSLITSDDRRVEAPHYGSRYLIGRRVRQKATSAHEPDHRTEPSTRKLRIFAIDPAASKLEGKVTVAQVPFEPLASSAETTEAKRAEESTEARKPQGPVGKLFEIEIPEDCPVFKIDESVDLNKATVIHTDGYSPSESDYRFHAQMVYAVASQVHASFRRALGREIGWPFAGAEERRLRIRPFVAEEQNAWYDPNDGSLNFGYYEAAERTSDRTLPKGRVFTSLSHDIIAHETSHAMLDALRSNFSLPTSSDMTGFHEGFADLIALFHHFLHPDALRTAIRSSRGDLSKSDYLSKIGQQFGRSTGIAPLRSAINNKCYSEQLESHEMGEVLIGAVFEAYVTVFQRKTERYRCLATGGTGELPSGVLSPLLVDVLASKASDLAGQFLSMLIRAVDYLPPVDVRLGDYLRAIITADFDLLQDDPWGYREAIIDAFRRREIYPRDVFSLNEDSLLWHKPGERISLKPITDLSFKEIWFQSDPGSPVSVGEQIAQACALGEYVTRDVSVMREFGLVFDGDERLEDDRVTLPVIESVRTLRRPGPDGRVVFDTVAEILQCRTVRARQSMPGFELYGGSTVILDARGQVRMVIRKSVAGEGRIERRYQYLGGENGKKFWKTDRRRRQYVLRDRSAFRAMCQRRPEAD
jgi:hypothetical protein